MNAVISVVDINRSSVLPHQLAARSRHARCDRGAPIVDRTPLPPLTGTDGRPRKGVDPVGELEALRRVTAVSKAVAQARVADLLRAAPARGALDPIQRLSRRKWVNAAAQVSVLPARTTTAQDRRAIGQT